MIKWIRRKKIIELAGLKAEKECIIQRNNWTASRSVFDEGKLDKLSRRIAELEECLKD